MLRIFKLILVLAVTAHADDAIATNGEYCRGDCTKDASGNERCTFTTELNFYASEWGYYSFKECEGTNPVLQLEIGTTYTFDQTDTSNWYHPLGFAYYADGAHDDVDELEPGIVAPGSNSTCDVTNACPTPRYKLNDEYLGVANDTGDFGLDHYEPKFFLPVVDWKDQGNFTVELKLDDTVTQDIFYFCHIHQYMTGRIKISKDGKLVNPAYKPEIPYTYETPSKYDMECGTSNIDKFQLPHAMCPERFLCNVPDEGNQALKKYASCIESMDCHMVAGMTHEVPAGGSDEVSIFINQMIPHHQNAVNMAKALLKTGKLSCDDITEETDDCAMMGIVLSIINGQNFQIQAMRGVHDNKEYSEHKECPLVEGDDSDKDEGGSVPSEPPKQDAEGSNVTSAAMPRTSMKYYFAAVLSPFFSLMVAIILA